MKNVISTSSFLPQLILTLLFLACSLGLHAQLGTLSVQGVLTKSDGTAVDDGTYTLKFRLWKDASSTNPADKVHEEELQVETTGGVYSVILGLNTPFGPAATFSQPYYLGVVSGSSELTPRPRLTSAPYALALLGSSNVFPGSGTVLADALNVAGAINTASLSASGAVNGASVSATGAINGASVSASGAINGASVTASDYVSGLRMLATGGAPAGGVAGKGYSFGAGGDADGGLFSEGDNHVALYANAVKVLEGNNGGVTIPGLLTTGQRVRVPGSSGVTFMYGGFDDNDSGLFGTGDGQVAIYANGGQVARFTTPQGYNNNTDQIESSVKFYGIQKGPNAPQVEWDPNTGELQVDNSSRRLKRNIRPMNEDFSLILKVQPKLYNRKGYPDSLVEAGYIAEEFDSLGLHHLVHYYANGDVFGIDYSRVSLYLTEIVKVHQTEIEKMKAEIAALKEEKNALRTENNTLRADNTNLMSQQQSFDKQLDGLARRIQALESTATNR